MVLHVPNLRPSRRSLLTSLHLLPAGASEGFPCAGTDFCSGERGQQGGGLGELCRPRV